MSLIIVSQLSKPARLTLEGDPLGWWITFQCPLCSRVSQDLLISGDSRIGYQEGYTFSCDCQTITGPQGETMPAYHFTLYLMAIETTISLAGGNDDQPFDV